MLARIATLATATALLGLLLPPPSSVAHAALGHSLDLHRRGVRVFDNFQDPSAHDNDQEHPSFPGATGATLAIWKGTVEWGSTAHGNGDGDPYQPGGLGSGGANFDPVFLGHATGVGAVGDNVHSALTGEAPGVLAFTELNGAGWRIRYYETGGWEDGPGTNTGGAADIQAVATHEYGHALGLGHSGELAASMYPIATSGAVAQRSIEADDIAGLQSIYGTAAADKPRISGLSLSGSLLEISGSGFTLFGNEVWFTPALPSGDGEPVVLAGVVSSGGGTRIAVLLPDGVGPGDLWVRRAGDGHAALSNAWPLDTRVDGSSAGPPVVLSVTPDQAPALATGARQVQLVGDRFYSTTEVRVDGVALPAKQVKVIDDRTLRFDLPPLERLGEIPIEVVNALGSALSSISITSVDPPLLAIESPLLFSSEGVQLELGSAPGDLVFLAASFQLLPTVVPGLIQADIGNQFASLWILSVPVIGPSARASWSSPISGFPYGTEIHFQAAVLDGQSGSLPLRATNVQSATFFY